MHYRADARGAACERLAATVEAVDPVPRGRVEEQRIRSETEAAPWVCAFLRPETGVRGLCAAHDKRRAFPAGELH